MTKLFVSSRDASYEMLAASFKWKL